MAAEPLPDLTIALGERNTARDCRCRPPGMTGGATRVTAIVGSMAIHPAYSGDGRVRGVEGDEIGRISIQYDKDDPAPDVASKYTAAGDTLLLTGSGQWRRGVFHLPALRLGHGQNMGRGFPLGRPRLCRPQHHGHAAPAGRVRSPDQPLDPEALRNIAVARPTGMELTFGNDAGPADAACSRPVRDQRRELRGLGGWEPDLPWDWSKWDRQVATLQKAGLKWVPFLIAGLWRG